MRLPKVWFRPMPEVIIDRMKADAVQKFAQHSVLPDDPEYRTKTLDKLKKALRFHVDHTLPLDVEYTGTIRRKGYRIEKLSYQAAPHRYVTGCLYIPDGAGPFPAVLNVHGHHVEGHLKERVQQRGHLLAMNGFVCFSIDSIGSGDRSMESGKYEPHGGPRGTLLHSVGETMMGVEIADNMRAVDLLCSLSYVKADCIGVTGGSGGGNHTMYLTAFDDRIQAGLSVCSVGSYRSYIMGSNCICETIPGGIDICEEAGILACMAPRAFAMINGLYDNSPTFYPQEMLETWQAAKPFFQAMGVPEKLQYRIFPTDHGYYQDALEFMLGFFTRWLKHEGCGDPIPVDLASIEYLREDEAMVYPRGQRPSKLLNILQYCGVLSEQCRRERSGLTTEQRKAGLEKVLNCKPVEIVAVDTGIPADGWQRLVLTTNQGFCLPALMKPSRNGQWRILAAELGKNQLAERPYLREAFASDDGLLLMDLFANGETGTEYSLGDYNWWIFHNTSRSCFWLGWTMLGEWVREYTAAAAWLKKTCHASSILFYGYRAAGTAAVISAALYGTAAAVVTQEMRPTFDWSNEIPGVNTHSLVLCVTDILKYADVPDIEAMLPTGMLRKI